MALKHTYLGVYNNINRHRTISTKNVGLCLLLLSEFLARDSIYAIAHYMPSPVRLSVTRVDQSKRVEVRITQPSPQSSPMTLVSWSGTAHWNSNGKIGSGGAE